LPRRLEAGRNLVLVFPGDSLLINVTVIEQYGGICSADITKARPPCCWIIRSDLKKIQILAFVQLVYCLRIRLKIFRCGAFDLIHCLPVYLEA